MAELILGPDAPASPGRSYRDANERRELLYRLLGDLPDRERPISVRKVSEEEREGYLLEKLELDLNGFEPVPAFFAKPKNVSGRVPALLFNHSHGGGYDIGKKEFIEGRSYLQNPPYAEMVTGLGWAGLCIDTWVFGERNHATELDTFKAMLWQGRVLWGMMMYDSIRALDYLTSRPEVDPARIATLGISMGSTMAWWLAALDERVKVTVDICCLTEFHTLLRKNGLAKHGVYYYVPSLLKHFTTSDINALIAPRPHLALAGLQDGLTPPEGLDIVDAELKKVYAELGAPDNWRLIRYDTGHCETPEGRQEILAFLKAHV
ncbi:MAG: acetylxylan esterase [Candidatus Hydrogenedentes bacterium]|nr:acetylxylan esterase [Candidatus Hydrogenedentota bacterium]